MPNADAYAPPSGLRHRLARKWTALRVASPLRCEMPEPVLSVCFDDAPLSAATRGADILARHDLAATYYIATGLLGASGISGAICGAGDLRHLAGGGHEIALHGHAHGDMSRISPAEALADIRRNREILEQILGAAPSPHLAYPYGVTTVALISRAARLGGWVIVFTHDVAPEPSPYGIAPATLDALLRQARELGVRIMPVGAAWGHLFDGAPRQPRSRPPAGPADARTQGVTGHSG